MKGLILLLILFSNIFSIFENSARLAALGGCSSALKAELSAAEINPATQAFNRGIAVAGTWYTLYNEADLPYYTVCANAGYDISSFALFYSSFQSSIFSEQKYFVSQSFNLKPNIALGWGLSHYKTMIINEFDNSYSSLTIGSFINLPDKINLAFFANEIALSKNISSYIPYNQTIRAGISSDFSQAIIVASEVKIDSAKNTGAGIGIEIKPMKFLCLRSGVSIKPNTTAVGIGFSFPALNIDYALQYHQILGFTHLVSTKIIFKQYSPVVKKTLIELPEKSDINTITKNDLTFHFTNQVIADQILHKIKNKKIYRIEELKQLKSINERLLFDIETYFYVSPQNLDPIIYKLNHLKISGLTKAGLSKKSIQEFLYYRDEKGCYNSLNEINNLPISAENKAKIISIVKANESQ